MTRRALWFAFTCWLVSTPLGARAQNGDTASDTSRDDRARKFFEAGRGAYDVGSYREALGYFRQAYELSGRAPLLYNIGQCADRLRMDEDALEAWKRYLTEVPDADNRLQVQERIRVLEAVVQEKKDAAARAAAAQAASLAPEHVASAAAPAPQERGAVPPSTEQQTTAWYGRWYTWAGIGGAIAVAVIVVAVTSGSSGPATHHEPNSGITISALRATP